MKLNVCLTVLHQHCYKLKKMNTDKLLKRLEDIGRKLVELDPALNGYDDAIREIKKSQEYLLPMRISLNLIDLAC